MKNKTQKIEKFTKLLLKELELKTEVELWSFKELADFLIQNSWAKSKLGTLDIAVLDRVIEELFKLDDIEKIGAAMLKPNKNAKVPEYDRLSEGCDPNKCKCKK